MTPKESLDGKLFKNEIKKNKGLLSLRKSTHDKIKPLSITG
jgi:hypothetical protein